MRVLAVLGAALALTVSAAASLPHVRLPRDHYAHLAAGVEWWYVTADVRGSDGHRYSVFVTLFRHGGLVLPVSQVVNLDTGARIGRSEILYPAHVGSTNVDVRTPVATLHYDSAANSWSFGAFALTYGVRLSLTPTKPYALHGGGTGIIRLGTIQSGYYSASRARVEGSFYSNAGPVSLKGAGWFDHQWVEKIVVLSLPKWDWFACQFGDRTELMVYQFRDQSGRPITAGQGGTFIRGDGSTASVSDQRIVAGRRTLSAADRTWPLDWTIQIPSQRIKISLSAFVPNQLVQGFLHPTFWEGVTTATGTKHGICYVEETG